jgi:D-glycero-alpha-D-manno-heptose-7-phosphate kinase
MVLCYTGKPRQHGINNWEVFKRQVNGDRRVSQNLEKISTIAQALRKSLERSEWNAVGRLMREEWDFRRRNLRTISTPLIDKVISSALRQGALAGKVCGAGGGGCVTLLIEPDARARVEAAIVSAGAKVLPLQIDRAGVHLKFDG